MKQHSIRISSSLFSNIGLQNELIPFSSFQAIPDYTNLSYSFLSVTEKKE